MAVKLLTEQHLEFLIFKGGCTSSFASRLVKMLHCWKPHVTAQMKRRNVADTCIVENEINDELEKWKTSILGCVMSPSSN